jgi:hypothetical protein
MIEIDVAIFACGVGLGWWLRSRQADNNKPRIYAVQSNMRQAVYLHEFGTLDIPRAEAFASRVAANRPIRYRSLVGKHKLLRRSEWDRIITGEMVSRGLLMRQANKTLIPSPDFINYCRHLVASHARTAQRHAAQPAQG